MLHPWFLSKSWELKVDSVEWKLFLYNCNFDSEGREPFLMPWLLIVILTNALGENCRIRISGTITCFAFSQLQWNTYFKYWTIIKQLLFSTALTLPWHSQYMIIRFSVNDNLQSYISNWDFGGLSLMPCFTMLIVLYTSHI